MYMYVYIHVDWEHKHAYGMRKPRLCRTGHSLHTWWGCWLEEGSRCCTESGTQLQLQHFHLKHRQYRTPTRPTTSVSCTLGWALCTYMYYVCSSIEQNIEARVRTTSRNSLKLSICHTCCRGCVRRRFVAVIASQSADGGARHEAEHCLWVARKCSLRVGRQQACKSCKTMFMHVLCTYIQVPAHVCISSIIYS